MDHNLKGQIDEIEHNIYKIQIDAKIQQTKAEEIQEATRKILKEIEIIRNEKQLK